MKIVKIVGIILVIAFAAIQVVRPSRTNPPIDETHEIAAAISVPPAVSSIFDRSCNDCHSNKTAWPWYSNITPVSWWLVDHVNDGRKHLSLSEWSTYTLKRQAHKLEEIVEQIEQGEMPLKSYLILHPAAVLSKEDRELLVEWAKAEREKIVAKLPPDEQ